MSRYPHRGRMGHESTGRDREDAKRPKRWERGWFSHGPSLWICCPV